MPSSRPIDFDTERCHRRVRWLRPFSLVPGAPARSRSLELLRIPMKIPQNGVSGVISAHSVDAASGRGGRRTEIHPFLWGLIGDCAERWSGDHLPEMVSATRDSSSYQIRVHFF